MNKLLFSVLFTFFLVSLAVAVPHRTLVNLEKRNEDILNLDMESRMVMFKLTSGLNEIYSKVSAESAKTSLSKREPLLEEARQNMFRHYNSQLLHGAKYKVTKKERQEMVAMLWKKLTSYLFMVDQLDYHNGILV